MLVLSRQRDQAIMIGDDVEITVVDIRGDKVRLGITAPRRIQVHRKEVYEAIQRENQQAAKLKPHDVADVVQPKAPESHPRNDERGADHELPENAQPKAAADQPDDKPPKRDERSDEDGPATTGQA